MQNTTTAKPTDIPCLPCGAKIGQPCVTGTGNKTSPHGERRRYAANPTPQATDVPCPDCGAETGDFCTVAATGRRTVTHISRRFVAKGEPADPWANHPRVS